jgi:hypothetical protein
MQSKLDEYNKILEEDDGREILPLGDCAHQRINCALVWTNATCKPQTPRASWDST